MNPVRSISTAVLPFLLLAATALAGPTNLALNPAASVTADFEEFGHPAANVIDGDYGTQWGTNRNPYHWLRLDLGSEQAVSSIRLVGVNTQKDSWRYYTVNYDLYVGSSLDSLSYVGSGTLYDTPDGDSPGDSEWELRTDTWPVTGTLRFVEVRTTGGDHWPGFNELEVFSGSTVPVPGAGLLALAGVSTLGMLRRRYL